MFENICLSGCAWAVPFYIGVYKALVEVYDYDTLKTWNVCCISASCIIAIAITTGTQHEDVDNILQKVFHIADIYGSTCTLPFLQHFACECLFNLQGSYVEEINPRLHIAVSDFYNKLVIKNNFTDNRELFKYLYSTAHIPFYTTTLESLNLSLLDGGVACNLPKFKERTLYVSVADKHAHVNMFDQVSTLDLFYAATPDRYQDLKHIGYHRTKDFLDACSKTEITPTIKHYHNNFIPALAWVCFWYDKYIVIKSKRLFKKLVMQFLKCFDRYILSIVL